ncbi:hypothetical protein M3Y99_00767100 [Aphelenchoides fujianensis]|nr:hypothetical protein M3Y99_00767100 [Aphelenchoides fujianensis]
MPIELPTDDKIRGYDDRYFWHAGFHVHRLVVVVSMLGCLFNIFPLIYLTNREFAQFDVGRSVTAGLSLLAYLILFFGNSSKKKSFYWFYFIVQLSLLVLWLLGSLMAIYFAGVIIQRLLHPDAMESHLNIWWLIHIAVLMTGNRQDYGRQNAEVPVAILLITSSLLSLFGTLFQFYFMWIAYKGYVYLDRVLLNPLSPLKRVG